MDLAPEPNLKGCLAVLHHAAIQGRMLGLAGERDGLSRDRSKQLADLMDAVHNIPDLVQRWDACDEGLLRSMLKTYDDKWRPSASLLEAYDRAVSGAA
ncbi:MAG TPA: hypothetical protein VL049_24020 [Candidatus Dormibacteraeota bacterium]|nr:hypothetical protein [Candidatus Dormibacteraeota bacterium]